jgi:hypothetical protein
MICDKCQKGKIVLHAFSQGNCTKCNCDITTAHIPCDLVCEDCSNENMLCRECGVSIEKIEIVNRLRRETGLCSTKCTFVLDKYNYDFEKAYQHLKDNANKF